MKHIEPDYDIFSNCHITNKKRVRNMTQEQSKYKFHDLDIGDFFFNYKSYFYGVKVSRLMYFNIDLRCLERINEHDAGIYNYYLATYEVY